MTIVEEISEQNIQSSRFQGWDDSTSSIDLMLNPNFHLENLKHLLKREIYDSRQDIWKPSKLPPFFKYNSEEAVEDLMLELASRMQVPHVLGNIPEGIFNEQRRSVADAVCDFLLFKSEQYGISEADIARIASIVFDNITMFDSRAIKGFENININSRFGVKEVIAKKDDLKSQEGKQGGWLRW